MKDKYFLYVGNAYPHKNLEILIRASARAQVRVVYVGKDDYFYKKLHIKPSVNVTDKELADLYMHAEALVLPSFMEGFALPALEALSHGCPLIVSDIPVFHELLADIPKYFSPYDEAALVACLKTPPKRTKQFLVHAGHIVQKYSWSHMATETLAVYRGTE